MNLFKKGHKLMKLNKKFYIILLIIYFVILFTVLYIFGHVSNVNNSNFFNRFISLINIIPFANLGNTQSIIISIIRFIPLSFILPNIFNKLKQPYNFYITIISIIFLYEISKTLLLLGYGDINDIILGSFSTITIYKIFLKAQA